MKPLALTLTFAAAIGLAALAGMYGARRYMEVAPGPPSELPPTAVPPRRQAVTAPSGAARRPASGSTGLDRTGSPEPSVELATLSEGNPEAERWNEVNRAAIEALEAEDFEAAIEGFEDCLEALPDNPILSGNLAEALVRKAVADHERLRPCEHCPDLLGRALALAPERTDLGVLLERWEREAEAEADFWRESSQHFDLAYDGSRDEILWGSHRILELLEEGYTDFGELFARYPVEEGQPRIAVSLYRRESFDLLTGLGDWAGGAFDGTVRVPVGDFELEEARLRRILRHELVHAFVRAVGGTKVPGWLNEGLAQWLEDGRAQLLEASRAELDGRELFGLDSLQGSLASWEDPEQIALAYAQSVLFTDYLATHYGERTLVKLIEGCALGQDPADTFEQLTNVELAVVLDDLASELR